MRIRHATIEDTPQLVSLYQACFAEPPWYEVFNTHELSHEFNEFAEDDAKVWLVALDGDRIIGGTLGYELRPKHEVSDFVPPQFIGEFYLSELFVDPAYRGQGVAQALAHERFCVARHRGYAKATVRTSVQQKIIQHMYRQFGFSVVAMQQKISTKLIAGVQVECADDRVIMAGAIP